MVRGQHGVRYADLTQSPAFAFGEGLSYTTVEYDGLRVLGTEHGPDDVVRAEVTLTNTGPRPVRETVQVYVSDTVTSVTWAEKELKAYRKVDLAPGESTTVGLEVPVADCTLVDARGRRVVEPGEFELRVGPSSREDALLRATFTVTGSPEGCRHTPRAPEGARVDPAPSGAWWPCVRHRSRRAPLDGGLLAVDARRPQPRHDHRAERDGGRDDRDPDAQDVVRVLGHAHEHHRRRDEHRHEVHHLDERVDRGTGGVLERVAHRVADDRRVVRRRALAPVRAVLDDLLRVVPRAARVGEEHRHEDARADRPGEEPGERPDAQAEADGDGRERREQAGVASSRSESRVQMSTTLPYSGRSWNVMIPGCSRNWRRTSNTIAPAARVTASIARPEKRKTVAAPRMRPTSVIGEMIS